VTAGTALNGLAHCAEALYVQGHGAEGDEEAVRGARLISSALPRVLAAPDDAVAREELLRGAAHAGHALALNRLGLAHAMAQALGGTFGLPHGAMNALCLPPALEFNSRFVPDEVARFGEAVDGDPVERSRALALLGGFDRLRDFGVPEGDLARVADAAAERGGNLANPRPATPGEILEIFHRIY
jgi:maleylacetate reductase